MSETALRDRETSSAGAWLMRSLPSPHRGPAAPEPGPQPASPNEAGIGRKRDWSASLDLIHEATAAIRISEERATELEQELERTVARALERATALEAQVAAAQTRADLAERRAEEAEEWLARLHDAVVDGFTRRPSQDESAPAAPAPAQTVPAQAASV
ncbi:hypothetical protein ASF49_07880 [Methylobacterium sp. Leaf104]|uniref:hypothetical protein n=1 Tax=Methylobacterium TaxID=407 RepID=UPI0006F5CF42|nr:MULTISPECIES: hypothetical protein [Methylobacterium]KQP33778.1 hypothetical protein ASF49_07880 [Methylobacterium sp. Leaf104]MCI9879657.1 hypothetical protein [Methylobacterium goesingense]